MGFIGKQKVGIVKFLMHSGFVVWIGKQNQRTMTEKRIRAPDQLKFPRLKTGIVRIWIPPENARI